MTQQENEKKPHLIARILRIYGLAALFMFVAGMVGGAALAYFRMVP